jgi:Bacterial regulatory proteins, tetR family
VSADPLQPERRAARRARRNASTIRTMYTGDGGTQPRCIAGLRGPDGLMAPPRGYPSTLRHEQAALTRARIIDAARTAFVTNGYLGSTLAAVARDAGVCVQTVYNVGGGKAVLLKTVYDVTLAGMALARAASGDADLASFAETIEAERAAGTTATAHHVAEHFGLRDGVDVQMAQDILWAFTSPELADRLVNRRQWGWDRFQIWIGTTMADALTGPGG